MKKFKKAIALFLGMAMVAAQLSACGAVPGTSDDKSETKEENSETNTEANSGEKSTPAASSSEPITLTIVDWSDSSKSWRDEYHKKFMEEHQNVTINYTMLTPDQFKNTVMTSIVGGDAPDLFPVPIGMQLASCVAENWFLPLNDYLGEDFFDKFVEGTVVEGNHYIDGVYYTLPEKMAPTSVLMFCNKDILSECGVEVPTTYSEFLSACKTITEKGAGKYYGWIDGGKQVGRLESFVRGLADLDGGKAGNSSLVSTVDGRAPYASEAMIEAYKLLQRMYNDGSIHPDTVNLSGPEARAIFAEGEAAFICQGSWCISVWQEQNPNLNFGVMPLMIPDDGQKGYLPESECSAWTGISSQCKYPELAAEYLKGLYTGETGEEFQGGCVAAGERYSVIKGINEKYMPEGPSSDYYAAANEQTLSTPIATHREPAVTDFYAEVKTVEPSLGSIAQGVISGSITDIEGALKSCADSTTAEWKRAAEAAGLDYDTFEFPNWDPMKEYTAEDYEALK